MQNNEVLIDEIKYIKIFTLNSDLGQFEILLKADSSDDEIFFFEKSENAGRVTYKAPDKNVKDQLRMLISNDTDIKASDENSKACVLFKERLNAQD